MKIISWNVRGLNKQDKRLKVRNLIRKWGPNVDCLQETKMGLINRAVIRSLWGGLIKFFHRIANSHRRVNSIDRLMVNEVLSSDLAAIADYISQFYRQLYLEDVAHRPVLDDVEFFSISVEDASWLDRPFEEEEVFGVINDFNANKALGLDGFSMAFFQSCWGVLKTEIMAMLHNFHTQAVLRRVLMPRSLPLFLRKWMLWRSRTFGPLA